MLASEWTTSGMLSRFTVVRKLEDGLFPMGFSKEAADRNAKAGSNIISMESRQVLVSNCLVLFENFCLIDPGLSFYGSCSNSFVTYFAVKELY